MTVGQFKYLDPDTVDQHATAHPQKPWSKVDGGGISYKHTSKPREVTSLRGQSDGAYTTDNAGFQLVGRPTAVTDFRSDETIRRDYYTEVAELVRSKLGARDVVVFDHTVRRNEKSSPRQPVQQVHVDQTPAAAEARVRKHVKPEEVDQWLQGRYQIVNVWRPIENPAKDFPLAVLDWRSTKPEDFVKVDLLYPEYAPEDGAGKEELPRDGSKGTLDGYKVRGETYGVVPNEGHRFHFVKDMRPDEVLFLKCFDSFGERVGGKKGLADNSAHTAFIDPETPKDAPGRQSIEVRCLVSY